MGDTKSDEVIDGTKLSILGLLARVSIRQLFVSVSVVLGVGFGAAKLHTAYIEKRDADVGTEQILTAVRDRNEIAAKLSNVERELSACSDRPCLGLDSYYVNTAIGQFNVAQCFADTMAAAPKIGFSATRVEHEVKLNGSVGGANHFCSVSCGEQLIAVSCNGPSNAANIGLTNRIKDQLIR